MPLLSLAQNVATESDVEQKIVMPLLTADSPNGLGISPCAIKTKPNIRQFMLGKGAEQKLYYPDYVIIVAGLPLLIVEAKAPGEDLDEAYREARLYATELRAYPSRPNQGHFRSQIMAVRQPTGIGSKLRVPIFSKPCLQDNLHQRTATDSR
jgi:type I site-specific restriction endonuclease